MAEVALVITTADRPEALRRCLWGISVVSLPGKLEWADLEVLLVDDSGSPLIGEIAAGAGKRLPGFKHLRCAGEGFRPAARRNEGVRQSSAPFLLFLDGDCLPGQEYLRGHLSALRPGSFGVSRCYRLREDQVELADQPGKQSAFLPFAGDTWARLQELAARALRADRDKVARAIEGKISGKIAPTGGGLSVCRDDFERVNGYDENFVGWGAEDNDLADRLRLAGVEPVNLVGGALAIHWPHSRHYTKSQSYSESVNAAYAQRAGRLIRCRRGLRTLELSEVPLEQARPDPAAGVYHALATAVERRFPRPVTGLPGDGIGLAYHTGRESLGPLPGRAVKALFLGAPPEGARARRGAVLQAGRLLVPFPRHRLPLSLSARALELELPAPHTPHHDWRVLPPEVVAGALCAALEKIF